MIGFTVGTTRSGDTGHQRDRDQEPCQILKMEFEMIYDDLDVDKNNLDEEWMRQPRLYFNYSMKLADAIRERDKLKAKFDLRRSEIMEDIRVNPHSYDMGKLTDASILSKAITQSEYQDSLNQLNEAERAVNILQGAVWAAQHKKSSLEYLTRLFLANYYAEDVHVTDRQKEEFLEKQVSQATREGLQNNPRLRRRQLKTTK